MAKEKAPAFQFYAKDFLTGTATMSLSERGAYVTFLAHQWDLGSVPAAAKDRARMLGCTAAEEKRIWIKLVTKFDCIDGVFKNERLEEERQKQAEYRRRQSDKGKASAATRRQPDVNHGSTTVESRLEPEGQPKSNSSVFSLQSSRTQEAINPPTSKHRGGLIVGPAEFARLQELNSFVGAVLRVPHKLHRELAGKSGADAEGKLQAWYRVLDEQLEQSGKGTGDVFEWLRPRHQAHAIQCGWIDAAPKVNGAKRDGAALTARLEAIERGEVRR